VLFFSLLLFPYLHLPFNGGIKHQYFTILADFPQDGF